MKEAEAAKVMAIRKGRGSTPMAWAAAMAMGASSTAVALLDMPSVSSVVIRYSADTTATGPRLPITSIRKPESRAAAPLFCKATPRLKAPASRKITFHSMAS